ncbi:MAG: hypothetical protein JSS81_02495 [Acidobacteria bacterium]|nr:hypothetical protein [Acidobacteriota bacterium]
MIDMNLRTLLKTVFVVCFLLFVILIVVVAVMAKAKMLTMSAVRMNPLLTLPVFALGGVFLLGLFCGAASAIVRGRQKQKVFERGQTLEAMIIGAEPAGRGNTFETVARLTLQVRPLNAPAFVRTVEHSIKHINVPSYQPGKVLYVKYVPQTGELEIAGPKI